MLKASKIGMKFLYNWCKESLTGGNSNENISSKCNKLRALQKTLESYGGLLAKISQCLSMNNMNSSVFDNCKPFSSTKTHQYVLNLINKEELLFTIIPIIFKSGSIGQVYKGEYKNEKIIIKVKYIGLEDQVYEDLKVAKLIKNYLYSSFDTKRVLAEIEKSTLEELDFLNEMKNHETIYSLWKDSKVISIPKVYPHLCKKNIFISEFIKDAQTIADFGKTATQEEKNIIAYNLVTFIFTNIYTHNLLYSDCHYGNFLITRDPKTNKPILNIIDFGCVHKVSDKILSYLKKMNKYIKRKEKDKFIKYAYKLNLLSEQCDVESENYFYNTWDDNNKPWYIEKEFTFSEEWLCDLDKKKDFQKMKQWSVPPELLYFNKIPFGLFRILSFLNASGEFYKIFKSLNI